MRKVIPLFLILSLLLQTSVFALDHDTEAVPDTTWYTGDGIYTITVADELAGLAELVNAGNDFSGETVYLGASIDLSDYADYDWGRGWIPIGNWAKYFNGTFDGGGHTISNLTIYRGEDEQDAALFGNLDIDGQVKHLNLFGVNITGNGFAGGIAAFSRGVVQNCYNVGRISGDGYVGGIAGESSPF